MINLNIEYINKDLHGKSPAEIISWALGVAKNPLVTTNFRPYEVVILHACKQVDPNLKADPNSET